jgi:geranylgeranyl pyrophosphate synthase
MSWNDQVLAFIRQHPYLASWPDAPVVLDAFDESLRVLLPTALPLHTCHAAGGDAEQAVPLGAAFTLLHMAASVLDDFQDQDADTPWTGWSLDRALASTLSMVFLSQSCLARLEADGPAKREILDGYAEGWLLASVGQNEPVDPRRMTSTYWRHALAKAAIGFSVASWSGVRLATDDAAIQQAAREYGMALGTLLQIADDIQDFLAAPDARSPSALAACLPVVLACERADHPARARLAERLAKSQQDAAWARAVYDLVLELGGLSRALATGKIYEQKALDSLSAFNAERSSALADYVGAILPDYAAP